MKKRLIFLIASGLAGVMTIPVSAIPEEPAVSAAPVISFRETVHDAGEVWVGETVSHTFTFTNTGNADLEITRVLSCCGLRIKILPGNRIAPGESGEIQATFAFRGGRGRQVKPFTVSSNDSKNPNVQLKIEATVKSIAAFSPANLHFGQIKIGEEAIREVKLIFDSEPIPILEVFAQPDFFQVRKVEMENNGAAPEEARTFRIEVALSPEAPVGSHRGTLAARFDKPGVPDLTGRLITVVRRLIEHSPRNLTFSETEQSQQIEKIIRVVNRGEQPITILEAESTIPQFQVKVKTIHPGKEFAVAVQLRPDAVPGLYSGEIKIESDLARQKLILVPLRSAVSP